MGDFVDGDCGGPSAPVSLASHFTRDKGFIEEGIHPGHPQSELTSQQLVSEFVDERLTGITNPFHMGTLLNQMHIIENGSKRIPVESFHWVSDFQREQLPHSLQSATQVRYNRDPFMGNSGLSLMLGKENWNLKTEIVDEPKWCVEKQRGLDEQDDSSDAFRNAATEFLEMADTQDGAKLLQTEFADFMRSVATGDVSTPEHVRQGSLPAHYGQPLVIEVAASQEFVNEFNQGRVVDQEENWQDDFKGTQKDFWDKMASEWEKISSKEDIPWLSEFYDYSNLNKEYNFSTDNPMENMVNALEEGEKRLQKGDLPGAVLCFESAVKQTPDNAMAWQLLGTTQAENEQDVQAIAALNKCIALDANNLTAFMGLAVSYTNENYQNQACKALKEWIRSNPEYSDLIKDRAFPDEKTVSSLMSKELYEAVKDVFLVAARRNPQGKIDADVQTGLSVLFNLSGEPDRAADCCQVALSIRPNDYRLWNRLGATLANGGRSEEAVEAYRTALELSPGFIRARYNLGISCVHLKAYSEAAEHLLIALNQQVRAVGLNGETSYMSDTIWTTLRLVISLLERADLMPEVNSRNLGKLNEAFNIN